MIGVEKPITSAWPLVFYFALVIALTTVMIALSYILGERHKERATDAPYESGVVSFGSARLRLSAKFYLVALFFVIFDLEATFIFAWAVALYQVGWKGYIEMSIFIVILFAALIYLWRLGALDWNPRPTKRVQSDAR